MSKNINIKFPFQDSQKGYYLDLSVTSKDAIKADLMHLILTRKGTRYYKPDFGTNLLKFIFEPNDFISQSTINQDIRDTIKKYLPNLQVDNIKINKSKTDNHLANVIIEYTITDNVFQETDFIEINI